jgi:hypothetical protein
VTVTKTKLEVKARNRKAAKLKANDLVKEQGFDPAKARIKTEIKFPVDRR